ncbi:MAG: hypothetical protein COB66_04825 [Coxiella sp. (in: Bacteria)]|nr:MAG: hypothetical protein COB66_04825 [Coxiella sp. (in: g-proteobacteria)]
MPSRLGEGYIIPEKKAGDERSVAVLLSHTPSDEARRAAWTRLAMGRILTKDGGVWAHLKGSDVCVIATPELGGAWETQVIESLEIEEHSKRVAQGDRDITPSKPTTYPRKGDDFHKYLGRYTKGIKVAHGLFVESKASISNTDPKLNYVWGSALNDYYRSEEILFLNKVSEVEEAYGNKTSLLYEIIRSGQTEFLKGKDLRLKRNPGNHTHQMVTKLHLSMEAVLMYFLVRDFRAICYGGKHTEVMKKLVTYWGKILHGSTFEIDAFWIPPTKLVTADDEKDIHLMSELAAISGHKHEAELAQADVTSLQGLVARYRKGEALSPNEIVSAVAMCDAWKNKHTNLKAMIPPQERKHMLGIMCFLADGVGMDCDFFHRLQLFYLCIAAGMNEGHRHDMVSGGDTKDVIPLGVGHPSAFSPIIVEPKEGAVVFRRKRIPSCGAEEADKRRPQSVPSPSPSTSPTRAY